MPNYASTIFLVVMKKPYKWQTLQGMTLYVTFSILHFPTRDRDRGGCQGMAQWYGSSTGELVQRAPLFQ